MNKISLVTTTIAILISLISISAFAKKGEMTFSSAVEVSPREKITAYDLVETKNVSEEQLEQLRNVVLGNEQTRSISKSDLARKLRSIDSYFMFPSEVKLLRSNQKVSRMEVERKIKNRLLSNCEGCEFQIQINSVPANLTSDWDMDLNVDLNKNNVMIPVFSSGYSQNKGWITVEIKKHAVAAVLNRSVRIGEVITADMLKLEKRYIQNMTDSVIDRKSILGMQAGRFLSANQILLNRDLKREVILKKGQIVKAIFGQDSFEVSISALAEESGSIGDVIKVKNIDSQKMFAAKIIDRGLVKID